MCVTMVAVSTRTAHTAASVRRDTPSTARALAAEVNSTLIVVTVARVCQ